MREVGNANPSLAALDSACQQDNLNHAGSSQSHEFSSKTLDLVVTEFAISFAYSHSGAIWLTALLETLFSIISNSCQSIIQDHSILLFASLSMIFL